MEEGSSVTPSGPTFKEKTIEEILKSSFKDIAKTKLSNDAVKLTTEYMRIFVMEAMTRAAEQAKKEDSDEISLEHLEKILPQFLLDFA